jgi:acyl-CoA synthetase (AMP-forming)/AMP-acid ligase II
MAGSNLVPLTLVELLRCRAAAAPEFVGYTFLVDGDTEEVNVSYRQLDLQARAIAASLIECGLRGERALLIYPAGLEFISGFFGCLYAGVVAVPAYVPESGRYTRTTSASRLESIVRDARPRIALTVRSLAPSLEKVITHAGLGWLACLTTDDIAPGSSGGEIDFDSRADSLAMLQYTSGSTRTPRGVMLTHANLMHNAKVVKAFCEHIETDKYVSWLPAFHDMGLMSGVLQPLYSSIPAILLAPAAFLQRPVSWLRAISRYKATTSGGPNFAYELCIRRISRQEREGLELSSWTIAFNGSEPVRKTTLDRFAEAFRSCGFRKEALYPCYGLAEATLMVTGSRKGSGPVEKRLDAESSPNLGAASRNQSAEQRRIVISCGRVSSDQRVEIVDPETGARRMPGETGEIWISGPSVGVGYWKNREETEKTFGACIQTIGEGPFLRTGDLGFVEGDNVFVTGRLKDLIIIRGVNHFPHDLEFTAENSHAALRSGCSAAFQVEVEGEERAVLALEVDVRANPDCDEIIEAVLRAVSEKHEVQLCIVVLVKPGAIPKTSSGKIQRGETRKAFMEGKLDEIQRRYTRGSDEGLEESGSIRESFLAIDPQHRLAVAEFCLLEELSKALRTPVSRIDPKRPLSAFGLDSLTALELKNAIEVRLGGAVPVSKLLGGYSVRQITACLVEELDQGVPQPAIARPVEDSSDEYPLSSTQNAIWFFHQLAPDSSVYNISFALSLHSRVEVAALEWAFQHLIDRHQGLRTTFKMRDGKLLQQVDPRLEFQLRKIDASTWGPEELDSAVTAEAYRPFELERGPLERVTLFSRSIEEHVLLLTVHHIIADGWSVWLLVDEFYQLYQARVTGAFLELEPVAYRYSDYVRWQDDLIRGAEGERLFRYWEQELSGGQLPILDLPASRVRPPVQTYKGGSHRFLVSDELLSRVKDFAASRDLTLYMVLLGVFQILLHRHSGQDDILVGSPISARSRREFESVVGCFFNSIVVRARFSSDVSFNEFLKQVRTRVLGALDHQDYPSHLLAERLQPVRDPSRPPLFQASFVFQKAQTHHASIKFGDMQEPAPQGQLAMSVFPIQRKQARLELELEMIENEGAIHAWLHYNSDLFDAAVIGRLAGHFLVLLEASILNPDVRVSVSPLLTGSEIEALLAEQTPELDSANYSGVEGFFLEQVKKGPERIAAVRNDGSVTFQEIDKRSDQLASLLSKLVN